jgi:transcriptional regulator with XRE-family HTH domain
MNQSIEIDVSSISGVLPQMNRLHGCQARAARAMLSWSVRQLAQASGISDSSIRRIEASFGVPDTVTLDLLDKLLKFFEGRGFKFAWDENDGPGVFWRRQVERRSGSDRRSE